MARRTFAEYKAEIEHGLGNIPSTGVTTDSLVNDALNSLCAMKPWRWRMGGPVTADLVQDQAYVELPLDFGELISIEYPGSVLRGMIPTTMATIERLRASTIAPALFGYYYAIASGNVDSVAPENGLAVSTIELYPTPRSSLTDALSITYMRDVAQLEDDADIPQIPIWMDRALTLLARAMANEVEDEDPNSAARQAFNIELQTCIRRDAGTQTRYGVMSGGLYPRTEGLDPFYPATIGDPH